MNVGLIVWPWLSPDPWYWPWIFKVKFWDSNISWMRRPIDLGWKGCESIGYWTHCVTLSYDLNFGYAGPIPGMGWPIVVFSLDLIHDLGPRFSRSNFEKLYLRNGTVDWHGTKGNRRVSQMQVPLVAYREPMGSYNRLLEVQYVCEHNTRYL